MSQTPDAAALDHARVAARQTAMRQLLRVERRLRRRLPDLSPQERVHWQAAREVIAERGVRLPYPEMTLHNWPS